MIILKSERLYLRQYRKEDIDPFHFILFFLKQLLVIMKVKASEG